MKTFATYYTDSGNTKKVAEAIYGAIEGEMHKDPADHMMKMDDPVNFTFTTFFRR